MASKEERVLAQRMANLLNEFLEKDLTKEDMSAPGQIEHYWKILEENFWRKKMTIQDCVDYTKWTHLGDNSWHQEFISPAPVGFFKAEYSYLFKEILGPIKDEEIEFAIAILLFHKFLNYLREGDSKGLKWGLRPKSYEDLFAKPIDGHVPRYFDPFISRYEKSFNDDLKWSMHYLKKCKDKLCGKWKGGKGDLQVRSSGRRKWFVQTGNKEFCCHGCASRYRKRMKEGKGDLQLSYRTRRRNKKKVAISEGGINGAKQ